MEKKTKYEMEAGVMVMYNYGLHVTPNYVQFNGLYGVLWGIKGVSTTRSNRATGNSATKHSCMKESRQLNKCAALRLAAVGQISHFMLI